MIAEFFPWLRKKNPSHLAELRKLLRRLRSHYQSVQSKRFFEQMKEEPKQWEKDSMDKERDGSKAEAYQIIPVKHGAGNVGTYKTASGSR